MKKGTHLKYYNFIIKDYNNRIFIVFNNTFYKNIILVTKYNDIFFKLFFKSKIKF
jgi:hypothetical protein